jgi:UDP-N-acetylglucosamine 4,6-dehydratase
MLKNTSVMITGGTGSFGQAFVNRLLERDEVRKIIVFSRDELKQYEMRAKFNSPKLRYFLGDVRDYSRLLQATHEVDYIVHAAAIKHVEAAEYNPMEAINTNILGAQNIVNSAIANNVKKVIALSTDKAASPANLYGATKLCSDKIMATGNILSGSRATRFASVRYGNVIGSRGSVIPFFLSKACETSVPITDERMTRFWLTIEDGVNFVLDSLNNMTGGEIFIPKIRSFKVVDVAKVLRPNTPIKVIGIRPGEKLHEMMITEDDAKYTYELEKSYVILPSHVMNSDEWDKYGSKVPENFTFTSLNNKLWFDDDSFRNLLKNSGIL